MVARWLLSIVRFFPVSDRISLRCHSHALQLDDERVLFFRLQGGSSAVSVVLLVSIASVFSVTLTDVTLSLWPSVAASAACASRPFVSAMSATMTRPRLPPTVSVQ